MVAMLRVVMTLLFLMSLGLPMAAAQEKPRPDMSISEELPPGLCPAGSSVSGLWCDGRYCDNFGWWCGQRGHTTGQDGVFTGYFSEETKSLIRCPPGKIVAGFGCRGSFCDKVALYCVSSRYKSFGDCIDTLPVSEEDPGYITWPNDLVPIGIRCFGSNCDDKSMRLCKPRS